MSDPKDDAYSDACEEIEGLKRQLANARNLLSESARVVVKADVEMTRLKESLAEAYRWDANHMSEKQVLFSVLSKKDALITELADLLDERRNRPDGCECDLCKRVDDLLHRARKATKE